jgi:hypothetical protein
MSCLFMSSFMSWLLVGKFGERLVCWLAMKNTAFAAKFILVLAVAILAQLADGKDNVSHAQTLNTWRNFCGPLWCSERGVLAWAPAVCCCATG